MTFPIVVEPSDDQFCAKLLGEPSLCAVRATRHEAVDALTEELQSRIARGEIVMVELPKKRGVAGIAGQHADDPSLREIVVEIYAERDRERDELFPE